MISGTPTNGNSKLRKTCLLVDDDEDDTEIFALAASEADSSIDCRTFIALRQNIYTGLYLSRFEHAAYEREGMPDRDQKTSASR